MTDETLWVWRYELSSDSRLNAASPRQTFPGALLRMGAGYACLHPWPELGDPNLTDCLKNITACPMGPRIRHCLTIDGLAREQGTSLFEGADVPPSHATLPVVTEDRLAQCHALGFTHIKVKVSGNLAEIRQMMANHQSLKWRLDFNGSGHPTMFDDWREEERACLDFVEDPFPPEQGSWDDLPVTPAADRYHLKAPVCVVKPAVEPIPVTTARTVITSYMDHPLGQSFAAYEAARCPTKEICGLQTHGLFKVDEFTEALGEVKPAFQPASGTGLGFDDLLEKLPWKKL